jgi:hypothetical protein
MVEPGDGDGLGHAEFSIGERFMKVDSSSYSSLPTKKHVIYPPTHYVLFSSTSTISANCSFETGLTVPLKNPAQFLDMRFSTSTILALVIAVTSSAPTKRQNENIDTDILQYALTV